MERETPVRVGERTNHRKTRMLVEEGIADNEGRPAAFLLVAGLRIEGNGDEVAFSWNVVTHLPRLTADRIAPSDFPFRVAFGDSCNEGF